MREPDWESLNEINFQLYNRVADSLNAALSAMTIAEMPDPSGQSPQWWYDRAKAKVESVLNLTMSWSWLIQYKSGTNLTEKAIRPFRLQALLDWLSVNLQLIPPLKTQHNVYLQANQQILQETLLLLHSVATTQGSGVSIYLDHLPNAVRFRIQFSRLRAVTTPYVSVDAFLEAQSTHWRQQVISFELRTARDFLKMNQIELSINDNGRSAAFVFTVVQPGRQEDDNTQGISPTEVYSEQVVSRITNATLHAKRPPSEQLTTEDKTTTMKQYQKQGWHPPQQRATLAAPAAKPKPDPIPTRPLRPGGWHSPMKYPGNTNAETPIIIGLKLPTPSLPPRFKTLDSKRETENVERPESNRQQPDQDREPPRDEAPGEAQK